MMESSDNFYVFLPSNSSSQYFPENTHSNYKVQLPKPLELSGEYEVALVQSFFLSNWFNIVNDDGDISLLQKSGKVKSFNIKEGYYNTAESLVQEINMEIIKNYGYNYNPSNVKERGLALDSVIVRVRKLLGTRDDMNKKQSDLEILKNELNYLKNEVDKAKFTAIALESEFIDESKAIEERKSKHLKNHQKIEGELEKQKLSNSENLDTKLLNKIFIERLEKLNAENKKKSTEEEEILTKLQTRRSAAEQHYSTLKISLERKGN